MIVTDNSTFRSSIASVQIRVTSDRAPSISLVEGTNRLFTGETRSGSGTGLYYLNPEMMPRIGMAVDVPNVGATNCTWTTDDPSFDLPAHSLTAVERNMPPGVTKTIFLLLRDGTLNPGSSLTFNLLCVTTIQDRRKLSVLEGQYSGMLILTSVCYFPNSCTTHTVATFNSVAERFSVHKKFIFIASLFHLLFSC